MVLINGITSPDSQKQYNRLFNGSVILPKDEAAHSVTVSMYYVPPVPVVDQVVGFIGTAIGTAAHDGLPTSTLKIFGDSLTWADM